MKNHSLLIVLVLAIVMLATACGGPKRPVLYPNQKMNAVGKEAAQKDIDGCIQLSVDAGLKTEKGKEVAQETVKGGFVGACIGGAIGLVTGRVGRSAGVGAAAGATAGLLHSGMDRDLDPVQQRFVEQCLRDRGYQPIGWK